jgi:hypothetical protein
MPENASLSGTIDQIDLGFVEREATPRLLMKRSIQLYLAELSRSQTVSATPKPKQPTTGSDRSALHGISVSEHYRTKGAVN